MAAMMDTAFCFQQLLIGTHKIYPIMETDEPENITKKNVWILTLILTRAETKEAS